MIVKQYIKDFEKLGFGMFVHFGLYSMFGEGEWNKEENHLDPEDYYPKAKDFNPAPDWAEKLVATAKKAGCKYITLTTRHHEGYSLFDTCGLNEYDSMHSACKRDLVREFVDACNAQGIIPFFYHTLLDWHEESYQKDFKAYLVYLRKSVELLCKNYGKIGGIWFDGMWNKPNDDWEEDELYSMIRSYQPEAMIINNTGLDARGALGHIELDSVTFERGRPGVINQEGAPKYVASEMCQTVNDHWGYAEKDFCYKSLSDLIEDFASCRRYGANFLLNVGPMANGYLRPLDKALLEEVGNWEKISAEALYLPRPSGIEVESKPEDFILQNGNTYYLFCHKLPMQTNPNVVLFKESNMIDMFKFDKKIKSVSWLDNGQEIPFEQKDGTTTVRCTHYKYGTNLVVRIAKIVTE